MSESSNRWTVDLTLPRNYEVEVLPQIPLPSDTQDRIVHFGQPPENVDRALAVRVVPRTGLAWLGVIDGSYPSPPAACGAFSGPAAGSVCLAAGGEAMVKLGRPG